jgi:hypothetical protein
MCASFMQLLKMLPFMALAIPGVAQHAAAATWTQGIGFSGSAGLYCTTDSCSDSGVGGSVELGRLFDRRLGKLDAIEITIIPLHGPHYAAIALYAPQWEEPGSYSIVARWGSAVLTSSRSLGGISGLVNVSRAFTTEVPTLSVSLWLSARILITKFPLPAMKGKTLRLSWSNPAMRLTLNSAALPM